MTPTTSSPTERQYDRWRGTSASRGYDRKWKKVRDAYLAEFPLCEVCSTPDNPVIATLVHHDPPVTGPDDPGFFDPDRLQSICPPCHQRAHHEIRSHVEIRSRPALVVAKPPPRRKPVGAPTAPKAKRATQAGKKVDHSVSEAQQDPHCAVGWQYAEDVVAGTIVAGKFTRQACERALRDYRRAGTPKFPYQFDAEKASPICRFAERCVHTKGELAGEYIRLEPWQVFILISLWGWYHDRGARSGKRRFRRAYIEIARGNGKSLLLTIMGLYVLVTERGAPEVYSAAISRDQAKEIWLPAKLMMEQHPDKAQKWGIEVSQQALTCSRTGGRFLPISSEAANAEGKTPSIGLIDELHCHPDDRIFNVVARGCAKRAESLLVSITTAGSNISGVCYEKRDYLLKVLDGTLEDESLFGVVYTIDDGDDWKDPKVWPKANPNLNISIDEDSIRVAVAEAINSPISQNDVRTKHLCQWMQASVAWLSMEAWSRCGGDLDLAEFEGQPCWVGLDLSTRSDITAKVLLFRRDDGDGGQAGQPHWYMFPTHYVPAMTLDQNVSYRKWQGQGFMKTTPGEVTNFDQIEADLIEDTKRFDVRGVAVESWQSAQLKQHIEELGLPVYEVRNVYSMMSAPMKEMEALILDQRFHHDRRDDCLNWQASNVIARSDYKGNVTPDKEFPRNKIDSIVAGLFGLSIALNEPEPQYLEDEGVGIVWLR
jgi:phage terminase large subunit-like protein